MTYLDAMDMAAEARNQELWMTARRSECDGAALSDEHRREWQQHNKLAPERRVRDILADALLDYFWERHYYDTEANWSEGCYLPFFRDHVQDGDVIITFNYDALAERLLHSLDRWSPSDGYGFTVPLAGSNGVSPMKNRTSPVRVLKLHGSLGWYRPSSSSKEIRVVDHFFSWQGVYCRDSRTMPGEETQARKALLFPSFIKRIDNPTMASLWWQAADALRHAEQVAVIGYSLPSADQSAATLLATSLAINESHVVIVDPCSPHEVISRYHEVIGKRVDHRRMRFGEWVSAACPGLGV